VTEFKWTSLGSELLCVAEFRVDDAIMSLGQSPWRNRRVGYISGGSFEGERLRGEILPGGGNWSENGEIAPGQAVGAFDARTVFKTHDGALIYVTYSGRTLIPDEVLKEFRDPDQFGEVHPSRYYIRIAPVFETSDARYGWLNGVMAIGCGQKTAAGIRHWIFAIT